MPKDQLESPFKDMYIPKNIQHNAGVVNFMYVRLFCNRLHVNTLSNAL